MLPLWIALQFLSSLPVSLPGMPAPREVGRSLLWYPLVGLLFGLLLWLASHFLQGTSAPLHAALLLTLWVLLSGALHWMARRTVLTHGWAVLVTANALCRS